MKRLLLICLLFVLAVSCREPMGVERFVPGSGPFVFVVDMSDTTASYDFDFYTRVDGDPQEIVSLREIPLRLQWASPSDSLYRETVWLPMQGRGTFFSRDVRAAYRADVRPYEAGIWTLTARLPDTLSVPGLRGLGLVMTKKR